MFDVLERLCGIVDELVEADPHAVACDEVLIDGSEGAPTAFVITLVQRQR